MALAKWYKVDFHTHTPESRCFPDKSVTARTWLQASKDAGLNVVVVTDHNSVGYINKIEDVKNEFEDENFKVFYGIELCVSAAFTHILLIFDNSLSVTQIEDAVIANLELKRMEWNNTEINVSEDKLRSLCIELKNRMFIIPAHFASSKGLGTCGINAIKKYKEFIDFSAVEVRKVEDVREYNNKVQLEAINKCVMITGSDNPSSRDDAQHAIEGLGKMFTWVKLSQLTFEGLRQVFVDPEHRCINWLELQKIGVDYNPNEVTYNYISGINYSGITHMTDMNMRFSANLNCIVGGRGTGKSTIVDTINFGVKNETELNKCKLLEKTLEKTGKITTYYNIGASKDYMIETTRKGKSLEYTVHDENGIVSEPPEFKIDFYGQKEIFALIEDDENVINNGISPLVKMIDGKISSELYSYSDDIDQSIMVMMKSSDEYKNNRKKTNELPTIKAEIEKAESVLKKFKASGLEEARNEFEKIDVKIKNIEKVENNAISFCYKTIEHIELQVEGIKDIVAEYRDTAETNKNAIISLEEILQMYGRITSELLLEVEKIEQVKQSYELSSDYTKREEINDKYIKALEELKNTGGESIQEIQDQLQANKNRYKELQSIHKNQKDMEETIKNSIEEFIKKRKNLTEKRKQVIEKLELKNISIDIELLGHKSRWKQNMQKELGREATFDNEFKNLAETVLCQNDDYANYKKFLLCLLVSEDGDMSNIYSGDARFNNIWKDKCKNDTLSSLVKVIPEDKVGIKIIEETGEIDINEGSPGQKSAAILAFILNSGDNPLIIDQPEDDLDNSLIYNLIVKSIRKMKNKRQIIVVTHNPNIPVLGDAEAIFILERNSEGKVTFRKNKKGGCIEEKIIREGICDIMEGGEEAFRKRELKYQY